MLNFAIIAIPTAYAALVGFQFVSGLIRLWQQPRFTVAPVAPVAVEPQTELQTTISKAIAIDTVALDAIINKVIASVPVDTVKVKPLRSVAAAMPAPATLDITVEELEEMEAQLPVLRPTCVLLDPDRTYLTTELRTLCTFVGIRWNRANNGKHLSRHAMQVALEALEQEVCSQ